MSQLHSIPTLKIAFEMNFELSKWAWPLLVRYSTVSLDSCFWNEGADLQDLSFFKINKIPFAVHWCSFLAL